MKEFKFTFGDRIVVTAKGFYEGCYGTVFEYREITVTDNTNTSRDEIQYEIKLDIYDRNVWCISSQLEAQK